MAPMGSAGANMIIDGGPDRGNRNRLIKYLQAKTYGLAPGAIIDCIVATHPHDDHYPGLLDVLAQYQVAQIVDPDIRRSARRPPESPRNSSCSVRRHSSERVGGRPSTLRSS